MSIASRYDRSRRGSDADLVLPGGDDDHGGEHPKALKTFILEVTAGRPKGVGEATDAANAVALRADSGTDKSASAGGGEPIASENRLNAAPLAEPTPTEEQSPTTTIGTVIGRRNATVPRRTAVRKGMTPAARRRSNIPRAVRRWPALSASVLSHALLLVALTAVTIVQSRPPEPIELSIGPEPVDDIEFTEAEFASETHPEQPVEEAYAELLDPGAAALGAEVAGSLGELTADALTGEDAAAGSPQGSLGDVGALFGDSGSGMTEFGTGLGAAPLEPQFFGAKIEGRRIVFVLDNSGSMQAGRLETVNAELERCVASLDPDQEFYVIFYSDMAYPLFYPTPVDRYVRPTERTKEMLHEWLESVELCLGDAVLDALNAAASIEPDTIFLLSDGRIHGERKMAALLAGGGNFPLHTIGVGLGAGAVASRRNLGDVATANGGDFREAAVPDEMRELARRRPRPYHNEGPGPIWGRNVKPRSR